MRKKRLTKSQVGEIIVLYQRGETPKSIGEKFGIYNNSVSRILRRNKIPTNQLIQITKEQTDHICAQYRLGTNSEKLAKEIGIDPSTVCRILKRNGIDIKPSHINKRKYELNETWLDNINKEEKAYFLGFFWADGNVSRRGNGLSLRLHSKDKEILIKFSHYIYNKDRISHYISKETSVSRLYIYSKHIKEQMLRMGCFPNKSKTIKFPTKKVINNEMLPHFVRGLMDGDGCICIRKNGRVTVDFTGNKFIINSLKEIINDKNIKSKVFYAKTKDSWAIQINNKTQAISFLNWVYKDSNIHLKRKYDKYQEMIL